MSGSLVTDLCALARRYLARAEQEFAAAVADGDLERAGTVTGEAYGLSVALKRQERAAGENGP